MQLFVAWGGAERRNIVVIQLAGKPGHADMWFLHELCNKRLPGVPVAGEQEPFALRF